MLTWIEGPLDYGCDYHMLARFSSAAASGQIDVFVMPKIARARPIAITLNVQTRKSGKKRLRGSLARPAEAPSLRKRLTPKLISLGIGSDGSAALVDEVVALIEKEAALIGRSLARSRR